MTKHAKLIKSVRRRHWPMQSLRAFARAIVASGAGDAPMVSPRLRTAAELWITTKRIKPKSMEAV